MNALEKLKKVEQLLAEVVKEQAPFVLKEVEQAQSKVGTALLKLAK